ncbi:hypothetical protein M9H77_18150 [Catharanthus roseus]|uniref:Uncharacterized protein n=1 Tax=Catharanthus roseus TaxID=4058 RepID=A0ACC0B6L7_CATRO|nr:hypothetical protein M9H77_18150 [Catharanthus roseus]
MLPNELKKRRYNSMQYFYKLPFTSSLMKINNEAQEDVFLEKIGRSVLKPDDRFLKRILQKRAFLPISKTYILDTLLEIRKLSKASKTLSRILEFQEKFIERYLCKELHT